MNETALQTLGWTSQPDGSWEALINGTSYLIEEVNNKYYIYRATCYEQLDKAPDLMTAIQLVSKREG